ncbi:MAG: radical SAM/SPASM domain-containing protein [Geobacter sp.]|nr:radical SAM/SPASM domain-containing protein [Geobacter sp.]
MMTGQEQIVRKIEDSATDDTQEKRQLSLLHGADGCTVAALREYPSRLFVETTTRCNLRCRMCVKQTDGNCITEGDMSPAVFEALEPALPHAEALILNGIGEPLLHPRLDDFIRRAKALMPPHGWVGFQSNGLLINEKRADSLVEAGLDRICLSMDGVNPDTFREIRAGGEVGDLERALSALNNAKARSGSPLQIGLEFVVMRENARELPDALRWGAAKGVSFAIVSNLLPYDAEHVGRVAYDPNTDAAVEFFRPWKERAEREGIDLHRYFKLVWIFKRSAEEQRIVDFVDQMRGEARSREIFINLRNLLQRDEAWVDEIGNIFAEALRVAAETGIDLQLPEITPKSDRKCDFIDKGGAFVSWDGGVHSCYFLWHQFSCHFPDRKKYVKPRSFGRIIEHGIRDIWNAPEFRSFRQEVIRHEYPYCSNCSLVPCEYVYAEEFEQDCFANKVPCGDCFWCMGLFRCLQ